MSRAFRTLLEHIVDYAGMFPPAKLPLDEAIRNYARYRQEPESWMLGRFICPAAQLANFAPGHDDLLRSGAPFEFSVLARGGDSVQALVENVQRDLIDIESFGRRHGDAVRTEAYEARIPEAASSLFSEIAAQIDKVGPPTLAPFYEIASNDLNSIKAAVAQMAGLNAERSWVETRCRPAGLKLRCGGVATSAFPPVETVAAVIVACRDAGVPLKFTAGLHHPVRRFSATIQTHIHGFLNVFVAGVLATARRLNAAQVCRILQDDDSTNFMFDDNGLYWNEFGAGIEEIVTARRDGVLSFGSCSFDEPRDGLHSMGLLPTKDEE